MECFYCRSVVPDGAQSCPACGKELTVTGPESTGETEATIVEQSTSEIEATVIEQNAVATPENSSEEATVVAQPAVEPTLVASIPETEATLHQAPVEDATLVQTSEIAAPVAEVVSTPESSDGEATVRRVPTSEVFAFEAPVAEQPTVLQVADGEVTLVQSSISDPAQIGTSIPETPYPISEFASVPQTPIPGIEGEQTAPPPYAYGTGEYAGYPTGYPVAPVQQPQPPREPHQFAKPLPKGIAVGGLIVLFVALALLFFLGKDWAQSATYIADGAFGAGVLLLIVLIARSVIGMAWKTNLTRTRQYVSNIIVLVVIFAIGVTGILPVTQTQLHLAHGSYLRNNQQWEQALAQFDLANEKAPTSDEKALTYINWGENLSKKAQYEQGVSKFDVAIDTYTGSTTYRNRALKDRLNAYIDWGKLNLEQKKYGDAQTHFDKALDLINCEADCKQSVSALDAKAYYGLGKEQLDNKAYDNSVTTFKALLSKFASSDEAKQAHGDLAKALLGKGTADKAKSCPTAVPTYKDLASNYKDTLEGQQADKDLAAPQVIKGKFTNGAPTDGSAVAFLMQGIVLDSNGQPNIGRDEFFRRADKAPIAKINADGSFAFDPLPQGTYQLFWAYADGDTVHYRWYITNDNKVYYEAALGPLCTYDFGDITAKFKAS